MGKQFFLLVLVTLVSHTISAQGHNQYHYFAENDTCYLLADNVNVRNLASSKGDIIANIPIGTQVVILEQSTEKLTLHGLELPWYQVKFDTLVGYIWGGLIADGWIQSPNDKDLIFMYGVSSCRSKNLEWDTKAKQVKLQIRACKNNKELSKLELNAVGSLENMFRTINISGNKGLSSLKNIVNISLSQEMCGGINEEYVIFWQKEKLYYAFALSPWADVPIVIEDRLIFPTDKGGKKNIIIQEKKRLEYIDDSLEKAVIDYHKKIEYKWTGTKLKLGKVLVDKKTHY